MLMRRSDFRLLCVLKLTHVVLQFDSIPVNVVAVSQQQVPERPRRFEGRPPRT